MVTATTAAVALNLCDDCYAMHECTESEVSDE